MPKPWDEMTEDERNDFNMEAMRASARNYEEGPRPTNGREAECWNKLTDNGVFALKRGWPDFLCDSEGANGERVIFAVEVKRHPEDGPRAEQLAAMATLEWAGVPCFVWDRHVGFRRAGSQCTSGV